LDAILNPGARIASFTLVLIENAVSASGAGARDLQKLVDEILKCPGVLGKPLRPADGSRGIDTGQIVFAIALYMVDKANAILRTEAGRCRVIFPRLADEISTRGRKTKIRGGAVIEAGVGIGAFAVQWIAGSVSAEAGSDRSQTFFTGAIL